MSLPFLAIDLELTSLDVNTSEILSIGWVAGTASLIDLNSCYYKIIDTDAALNQSPTVHGLVEADLNKGESLEDVLKQLLPFAKSHLWVFHNAALDMPVIQAAFRTEGMDLPEIWTVDTLQLAVYSLQKQQRIFPPDAATLSACRQRYHLPISPAHHALDDALATLELLYALLFDLDPLGTSGLKAFSHTRGIKMFKTLSKS